MPRRPRKRTPAPSPDVQATPAENSGDSKAAETSRTPGTPAPESIIGQTEFTSPKGFKYTIIHTNESDETDKPKPTRRKRQRP